MPKRPREHQLEEESNRALVSALPSTWVSRRQDPDYGVDYTVEVFEGGASTGLSFNAQLKATDERDLSRALTSVRFRHETAEYYSALPLPLLVVRYHSPTRRLFARWFHAYDPHVTAGSRMATQQAASIAFHFQESDRWSEETPALIASGLRGFLKFRQAEHRLPLPFVVPPNGVVDPQQLATALRRVLKPVRDLISVQYRDPRPEDAVVVVGDNETRISLADVASVTIHYDDGRATPGWLSSNVAVGLAMALTNVGQTNLAAQIAAATGDQSALLTDPECCITIAGAFFRSRRVQEALRLLDRLDASGDEDRVMASYLLMSVLLARGRNLTAEERRVAEEVAEARYQRRIERGDTCGAASEAYNGAMLQKRLGEGEKARQRFELTAELDPTYLQRGYYHADLGGVLFELGRYQSAAEHYMRALSLGADRYVEALAADALIHDGRYAEAAEVLDRFLDAGNAAPEDAEWRLKRLALPLLSEVGGEQQSRDPEAANAEIGPVDFESAHDMSVEEAFERAESALSLDACCAEAWFRYAVLVLGKNEQREEGAGPALAAAVLHRHALGAWGNAIRLADPNDQGHLLDLIRVGYKFLGSELEELVLEIARDAEPGPGSTLRRLLEEAVEETDRREAMPGFKMRFGSPTGEMTELTFDPPRDPEGEGDGSAGQARRDEPFGNDEGDEVTTRIPPAGEALLAELRRRVGDDWFAEAGSMRFQVTEPGDVTLHTGKWISFMWGKGESEGMILAVHRGQTPAQLSVVGEDGRFEYLGPVEGEF